MKELLEAAITFFGELTWRRFRGFVILLLILVTGFVFFDSYTSYFTISRLRRSAELIAQVQAINTGDITKNPELNEAYKTLNRQVLEAVSVKPWTLRIAPPIIAIPYSRFWKFLAATAPWLLFSAIMIPNIVGRQPNAGHGLVGIWVIGGFFGLIGLIIPTYNWPWFNLIIFPLFFPSMLIIAAIIAGVLAAQKKRKQNLSL